MAQLGSGNGTSYPSSLDTRMTEVDSPAANKTKARAAVANDLYAATVALETALGTSPQGTVADVKTFLQTEHNADGTHKNLDIDITGSAVNASGTGTALYAAEPGLKIVRGYIEGDGTTITGSGFVSVKNSTGDYTITYQTAFSGTPVVSIGCMDSATRIAFKTGTTFPGALLVNTYASDGVTLGNARFYFIAIGPK